MITKKVNTGAFCVQTHHQETMTGSELIHYERLRQIAVEGWTPEHDDAHDQFELVRAARNYASPMVNSKTPCGASWPWDSKWWKPSDDPMCNLVKAGALIAAEIDRIKRQKLSA